MDYYQKFADATAPLVLLILGLPLRLHLRAEGILYGIAIALGLSILYVTPWAPCSTPWAPCSGPDLALVTWALAVLLACTGGYLLPNVRT